MLKPISIIFLLTALFSISVSELTSNNHPRGIFIQASTSTTWVLPSLKQWLDKICANNLQLPLNQRMDDFVLQDIAVETPNNGLNYTMLYDVLDVVVPYLPGGSIGCFKNIFVGTIDIQLRIYNYANILRTSRIPRRFIFGDPSTFDRTSATTIE